MFIRSFLDGVPRSSFAKGFTRRYHLGSCEVAFEAFGSSPDDVAAYRNACLSALQKPRKPDLAFVITSEKQEALRGNDSPYLVCKSVFMGQGVPVQNIQIETVRGDGLAYPLDSIALASYAKLGGTPYVIAAAAAMTQELVIGIGSAHVRQARLTDPERVVGITTVFSADGSYLLSNQSREADYADYPAELLRSLESCIGHVRERNGWQPEDALRLIFHVFKPLKDIEARAVKDLAQKLAGQYAKVEFAFLTVSDDHDWLLFDQHSSGYNGRGKGVPGRGHAIGVSRSEMLVSVTGPRDMKLRLQGLPKPLLLKLHRESTFTDMEYLAGQVFRFTAMSWRRPYPSREPGDDPVLRPHRRTARPPAARQELELRHRLFARSPRQEVVPVTAPPDDTSPATAYANSWLTTAAQRITADATPGSIDALLARYFLGSTPVPGLGQDSSRLSAAWLEENHDRLRQTPVVAAIGYGLAGALPGVQASARSMLVPSLRRLMSRNPFADRLTFVYDLPQLVGIGLAAQAVAADLPAFSEWLSGVLQDDRLQPSDRFQALLRAHVRALLSGQTTAVHAQQGDDVSVFALRYWMASTGTAHAARPR